MRTLFKLIAWSLLLGSVAIGQQNTENVPRLIGPYLGQKQPGTIPEIFASGIVSTGGFEHSKIEFTEDGSGIHWAAQPEGNDVGSLK